MKKRIILKVISVSPKERTEFARRYDFNNRIPSMAYTIDVPEDVRHQVKCKEEHIGNEESGLHVIKIHNQSSCPAVVTFFEFEE